MKRVVLVRTQGPRNAGLAARAAANFGPVELVFCAPVRRDLLEHPEFAEMSHGVDPSIVTIDVAATVDDALADCTYAVGFTARFREHRQVTRWGDVRTEIAPRAADPRERVALVFGNERFGLSADEAAPLADLVWIPTTTAHASINLGAAVTIVLADLFGDGPDREQSRKGRPVTYADREYLIRHLVDGLGSLAASDAARRDLVRSIERVFARAPLETRDARAWHRLLRAIGSRKSPRDLGLDEVPKRADRAEDERRAPPGS